MADVTKYNSLAAVLILSVTLAISSLGLALYLSGCAGDAVVEADPDLIPPAGESDGDQSIGNLSIGDRVVDYSWSGQGNKHVIWIVVAKDHYSGMDSHVTLLSEYMLNEIMPFDNSTRGEYGSNDWGTSGDPDATEYDLGYIQINRSQLNI